MWKNYGVKRLNARTIIYVKNVLNMIKAQDFSVRRFSTEIVGRSWLQKTTRRSVQWVWSWGLQASVKVAPGNSETLATRASRKWCLGKNPFKMGFQCFHHNLGRFRNLISGPLSDCCHFGSEHLQSRGTRLCGACGPLALQVGLFLVGGCRDFPWWIDGILWDFMGFYDILWGCNQQ